MSQEVLIPTVLVTQTIPVATADGSFGGSVPMVPQPASSLVGGLFGLALGNAGATAPFSFAGATIVTAAPALTLAAGQFVQISYSSFFTAGVTGTASGVTLQVMDQNSTSYDLIETVPVSTGQDGTLSRTFAFLAPAAGTYTFSVFGAASTESGVVITPQSTKIAVVAFP